MDIQEIAKSYAEGKANEAITKAIAQAYIDGYKDGYKSGKENAQIECNNAEFVDLGLSSGTLWASDYLKDENGEICYFTYDEALQYKIPTIEQYNELILTCLRRGFKDDFNQYSGVRFLGVNGTMMTFNKTGKIGFNAIMEQDFSYFWLLNDNKANYKTTACITSSNNSKIGVFCGFKLPIRLVR